MNGLARRWFVLGGWALWSAAGCGAPPAEEPVRRQEDAVEFMDETPAQAPPPASPSQECARPPPGATPTEALEALRPNPASCALFPAACRPEGLRPSYPSGSNACHMYGPTDEALPSYSVTYDERGRVLSSEGPLQRLREASTYDACGRRLSSDINPGGMVTSLYSWTYGSDGRLVAYTAQAGFSSSTTRYTYDALGRLTRAETEKQIMTGAPFLVSRDQYVHDAQGRIIQTWHETEPGSPTDRKVTLTEERTYAPSGELASLRSLADTSSTLKTLSEGRWVREQVVTSTTQQERAWTYSANGLLETEWTRTISASGSSTSELRYGYDSRDRLGDVTQSSVTLGPDGSQTSSGGAEYYTYGVDGRLRLRTSLNGATGNKVNWYYGGDCY